MSAKLYNSLYTLIYLCWLKLSEQEHLDVTAYPTKKKGWLAVKPHQSSFKANLLTCLHKLLCCEVIKLRRTVHIQILIKKKNRDKKALQQL